MTGIVWLMPPKRLMNSGVYKYSQLMMSEQDVKIIHLPDNWWCRYPFQYLFLPMFFMVCSSWWSKVILAEEGYSMLLPFILCKRIIIIHDLRTAKAAGGIKESLKHLYVVLTRSFIKYADVVIAVSYFTKSKVEGLLGRAKLKNTVIEVVENPIGIKEIAEFSGGIRQEVSSFFEQAKSIKSKIFLYVGSDETRKNTVNLAKAISDFMLRDSSYFFVRAGRPINLENHNATKEIFLSKKVSDRVLFLSEVSEYELCYLYENCDLFIMPSTYEGFGRTPIEAQMRGLPVLSTKASALAEVLGDSIIEIKYPYDDCAILSSLLDIDFGKLDGFIERGYLNAKRYSSERVHAKFWSIV